MLDLDPAAPGPAEAAVPDREYAVRLTNFGDSASDDGLPGFPGAKAAGVPVIAVDAAAARAFLHECTSAHPRVGYGLGKKVPFHGAVPGRDFQAVDCSGFVREAIWRGTEPHVNFRDGSVVQHDWVRDNGFARSSVNDAKQRDGVVRIAFLSPIDARSGIGHVVLVHNAMTIESHGGTEPDELPWTGQSWQAAAKVYVLSPGPQD